MLRRTEFFFLFRMPADSGWIKNDFRAAQRGQSRRFRVPLVPANADADFPARSVPSLKSKIARRKIKLLVIERVVRDVHLAIFADKFSIRVDDSGGVVIDTGPAFLKQGRDDDDAKLAREFAER